MRTKNKDLIAAIERFVGDYIDARGVSPSVKEIAEGTGMSVTNAHRYIASMRDSGMLDSTGGHRGIVTKA